MVLMIDGYMVEGTYTRARENFKRGEPRDTPPEPAQFDIDRVVDHDGGDVTETIGQPALEYLEREAVRIIQEEWGR